MEKNEQISKQTHHGQHQHTHHHGHHHHNHQESSHSHSGKKRQASRNKKKVHKHMGGLSNVPFQSVVRYLDHLHHTRSKMHTEHLQWKESIHSFKKIINSDPILRMNWEYGIYQCSKYLPNKSGDDVLDMIDTAVKTPPDYSNKDLVGFPINTIFIEFMQNENGRNFFSNQSVNQALKAILADYNKMLHSKVSLQYMNDSQPQGWFCAEACSKIDYSHYICDPKLPHYGFKCWNQWFLREFKAGMRPLGVGSPQNAHQDDIIVNSSQSTPLIYPKQPSFDVKLVDKFWLKDDLYSLVDMFGAQRYNKHQLAAHFEGGTVYQAFLSALFYHRWHAPVSGIIEEIYGIDGTYFLDQSQFIPFDKGSPNNSESFLTAVAARKVFIIKADNQKIGKIAIIFIGMAEVSSCIETVKVGDRVKKGDQIGHFAYGGSSHVIIFEKRVKLQFNDSLYEKDENDENDENDDHNNEKPLIAVKQNLHSYLALVRNDNEA